VTTVKDQADTAFKMINATHDDEVKVKRVRRSLVVVMSVSSSYLTLASSSSDCPFHLSETVTSSLTASYFMTENFCLQCFDAVGWAAGKASGL